MEENKPTEEKKMDEAKVLTLGEKRVRTEFNPGNNDKAQNLKEKYAHLINEVDALRGDGMIDGEMARSIAESLTLLETSCMFAVKAATY